jgi:hypothetical protein
MGVRRPWTKNRYVVVKRHSDGKSKKFASIQQAAAELKINPSYIKYALQNPTHITHYPDRWQPILTNGKLNTRAKPEFDFYYEEKDIVRLISQDELKEVRSYPSHYKCKEEMGFSSSTYQLKITNKSKDNIMKDLNGRRWAIELIKEG